eukprot:sb/3468038/
MTKRGEQLNEEGFGGIYGVGRAAETEPALIVLSHKPPCASKTIAWCGENYNAWDEEGLWRGCCYFGRIQGSCKLTTNQNSLFRSRDWLSANQRPAFPDSVGSWGDEVILRKQIWKEVECGFKENLHAVLCVAENSVGPRATVPDDVHTLYSGKTVEINNTDAEGRLVLGDGVAFAGKDLRADIVLDMATLTGAQGITTGLHHGAVLTNNAQWESSAVAAGLTSGDMVYPILYAPELHFSEFKSAMADMKNSVAVSVDDKPVPAVNVTGFCNTVNT